MHFLYKLFKIFSISYEESGKKYIPGRGTRMSDVGGIIKNQKATETAEGRVKIFEGKIYEDPFVEWSDSRVAPPSITKLNSNTSKEALENRYDGHPQENGNARFI